LGADRSRAQPAGPAQRRRVVCGQSRPADRPGAAPGVRAPALRPHRGTSTPVRVPAWPAARGRPGRSAAGGRRGDAGARDARRRRWGKGNAVTGPIVTGPIVVVGDLLLDRDVTGTAD